MKMFKHFYSGFLSLSIQYLISLGGMVSLYRREEKEKNIIEKYVAVKNGVCVNQGYGNNPLNGWINLDVCTSDGVICYNLRKGLPLKVSRVDYVDSEYFIEHLSFDRAV